MQRCIAIACFGSDMVLKCAPCAEDQAYVVLAAVRGLDTERVSRQSDQTQADSVRLLQTLEVEIPTARRDLARVVEDRHVDKAGWSPAQLGVHDQPVPIPKTEIRIAAHRRAAANRWQEKVRNGATVLMVSDRREASECNHPVRPQDRNELDDFSLQHLKRIQVVVEFTEIVELRTKEPTTARIAQRPTPVERRARRAVEIRETGELEPWRVRR